MCVAALRSAGMVIAPLEPTEEMWQGFFSCNAKLDEGTTEFYEWHGDFGNFAASYEAMLSAIPKETAG